MIAAGYAFTVNELECVLRDKNQAKNVGLIACLGKVDLEIDAFNARHLGVDAAIGV